MLYLHPAAVAFQFVNRDSINDVDVIPKGLY